MDMSFKRRILLAVTGLSPQVVTETLYALYHQGESLPTEVHVLSTSEGAARAQQTLLEERWVERLLNDYNLPHIVFLPEHIHVLADSCQCPLADIRTQDDNRFLADAITEWIRHFTEFDDSSLHVSLAGGRKTMGFYAGYALSLYGRHQDRLSHVLVSPEYESHPQFYYPTPKRRIIYAHDTARKPLDTKLADVVLADIPFVRLRHGLDKALLQGRHSFSESVKRAQQAFSAPQLVVAWQQGQLLAQQVPIPLAPVDMAFYCWLLERQADGLEAVKCPPDGAPDEIYAAQYLNVYSRIHGEMALTERTQKALDGGMSKNFFEQRKSRINQAIKAALHHAAEPYIIQALGNRPATRYAVQLPPGQVVYSRLA